MKFKEYVKVLTEFLVLHPETGEYDTIYSRDDEGNGYREVVFSPTIAEWDPNERDLVVHDEDEGTIEDYDSPNAVIIN